jgi:hypothetical protein
MTVTNNRYLYPRVAVIWIDVHLAGETRPTHHMHPTLSPRMVLDYTYLTRSTHSNLSRSHQQSWAGPLILRKRAPNTIHSTTTDRSASLYPVSLLSQSMKQWGQSQPSVDGRLLVLLGPYHRHMIGTFNTCSRGSTHRSLTDTGGGYNFEGVILPHHTPWASQLTVLRYPPKGPTRSQVVQVLPTKPKFEFNEPVATTWPTSTPSHS